MSAQISHNKTHRLLSLLVGQTLDAVNNASHTYMHLKWN